MRLEVRNHSVDAPLLWFTALVTLLMAGIAMRSIYRNSRLRKVLRLEDNRLRLRCRLGGLAWCVWSCGPATSVPPATPAPSPPG